MELRFSCVNHSRKETDPLARRRPSSLATVIPALRASVTLTLLELKRSHRTKAHSLAGETLISRWAEHPVGLPINTSRDTIQRERGRDKVVIKLICRPPVKYKPQASEQGKWRRRVKSAAAILMVSSWQWWEGLTPPARLLAASPSDLCGPEGMAVVKKLQFRCYSSHSWQKAGAALKQASVRVWVTLLHPSSPLVLYFSAGLWTNRVFFNTHPIFFKWAKKSRELSWRVPLTISLCLFGLFSNA